jgi:hypothetical protein
MKDECSIPDAEASLEDVDLSAAGVDSGTAKI